MSRQTLAFTDPLRHYLYQETLRETEVLRQLRETTAELPGAQMQIAPEQGQFMAWLVTLSGASKTLELGVYTGYSTLAVALALPQDGQVVACDVDTQWTNVAKDYWAQAGVSDKIDLRIAPALETLEQLLTDQQQEQFDFAFIDADKQNYPHYYELCLSLLRPGGIIMIDNVLWSGRVADPEDDNETTLIMRQLNHKLRTDERIDFSLLPVADGVALIHKR